MDAYKKEILNKFSIIRRLTSSSSPWVEKIKTDKIWICKYVGKLKGIWKQGEIKMNDINVHTIANFQRYVQSYAFPKLPIFGLGQIYEHGLVALPRKPTPSIKYHKKEKPPFLKIWIEMGREVKVIILHVKILLYHWSDPVYYEGSREPDERVCSWGWWL